jgi:hypothetical protein
MMFESLPGILAIAVATSAAAGEPKWSTYRSPSGLYSVDHPSDWKVEREENIVNIIPGDESGAVTISAYLGKAAESIPEQLVWGAFDTYQPTTPLRTVTGSGWKGVRRAFLDTSQTPHREWVAIVAKNARGMVLITSNEAEPKIEERAGIYARIFKSLKLSTRQL